jgi:hypothetical protein
MVEIKGADIETQMQTTVFTHISLQAIYDRLREHTVASSKHR